MTTETEYDSLALLAVARNKNGRSWLRCKDGTRRYTLLWLPGQFYFAGSRPDDELVRPEPAREPGLLE